MSKLGLAACLVATIGLGSSLACGGGGGGGGGGPTAPSAPPPPPPSTVEVTNDTLFGEVLGLFSPGTGFAGSSVRVVGSGEDTVRSDNSFYVAPVEPGEHVLLVSGPGHLRRHVRIEMLAGGANEIPKLDLAEDATFNLPAFDEIYREDGEAGTARLVERPTFLIDQQSFDKLPNMRGEPLIAAVEAAIKGPMARAISPFFRGVRVRTLAKIPEYANPCELPEGDVTWEAYGELESAEGEALLGQAWWCWFPEEGVIRGGIMSLDDEANTAVILHELVHLLGGANHLEKTAGSSVIQSPIFIPGLSSMDEQHLKFLYRRPPGLLSPDDARPLDAGDLTELSGGLRMGGLRGGSGMEVRCRIFADGRAEIERGFPGQLRR